MNSKINKSHLNTKKQTALVKTSIITIRSIKNAKIIIAAFQKKKRNEDQEEKKETKKFHLCR